MLIPGLMQSKRPAFAWGRVPLTTELGVEDFERYTNVPSQVTWWGHVWANLAAGDGGGWNEVPGVVESVGVVGDGNGSAWHNGAIWSGGAAMRFTLAYYPSSIESRDVFLRRTFTGLPASTLVEAAVRCGVGFATDSGPADAPIGIRVGAQLAMHLDLEVWRRMAVQVMTTAAGELTVDIGTFGLTGTDGYPLQRYLFFDLVTISLVGPAAATPGLLRCPYPLERAVSTPVLRDGSRLVRPQIGAPQAWDRGHDWRLSGDVRYIPRLDGLTREGLPVSGWEGLGGWEGFLGAAWEPQVMTFYPDQDNLAVSYPVYVLSPAPDGGAPYELEIDGTRRVALVIETAGTVTGASGARPIEGY